MSEPVPSLCFRHFIPICGLLYRWLSVGIEVSTSGCGGVLLHHVACGAHPSPRGGMEFRRMSPNFLIEVTVFISRIWPKLIMVSSADMVNGISMSSITFNWSAGAIFLFWHRFAESELGMASPCFIKGGHFMPFYFFFFSFLCLCLCLCLCLTLLFYFFLLQISEWAI